MKNKIYVFIILLITCNSCGKVPISVPGQDVLHFTGNFETGYLNQYEYFETDTAINTVIVTAPVRKGKFALKNTLNPGNYIFNGYRSELSVYDCAKYKTNVFYGLSFMIDTGYVDENFNLICQWHDMPDFNNGEDWSPMPLLHGSSPPVALIYLNGNIALKLNDNPNSNTETILVGDEHPINKGEWQDVVFHIYWSDDKTAFIECRLNGNYITPFNGSDNKYYYRNLFNRAGNYFKFGHYRGKSDTPHSNTIYFDEIKIGSTYKEVAP
ncbi:MAG: polysaccharide lyase [Bacteroidales bacterium]|nr:polysaccharide lyase [Bacteroidales bacterium]